MNEVQAYTRLAGVYDEIVVDPCYSLWAVFLHARWVQDAAGVHQVLDVCCGTGLMAVELTKRGYDVVGVDSSASMLERARASLGGDAELIEATLPDLGTVATFDAATSNFDGLNYLTPEDFRLSVAAIARCLRPGGWFIFDLHTDVMMRFTADNPRVEGEAAGNDFVVQSVVDLSARVCDTTIEVQRSRDGDPFVERHRQYFHSDEYVRTCLRAAGFTSIAVTDEYTDDHAGDTSLRATWSARARG